MKITKGWALFSALLILATVLFSATAKADAREYFGEPAPFVEVKLVHHIQPWMDWMLKDERKGWMGNNPRIHLEFGLEWNHGWRLAFVTGTSLFVGAPFHEKKAGRRNAELYWAHIEFGKKWGGK